MKTCGSTRTFPKRKIPVLILVSEDMMTNCSLNDHGMASPEAISAFKNSLSLIKVLIPVGKKSPTAIYLTNKANVLLYSPNLILPQLWTLCTLDLILEKSGLANYGPALPLGV